MVDVVRKEEKNMVDSQRGFPTLQQEIECDERWNHAFRWERDFWVFAEKEWLWLSSDIVHKSRQYSTIQYNTTDAKSRDRHSSWERGVGGRGVGLRRRWQQKRWKTAGRMNEWITDSREMDKSKNRVVSIFLWRESRPKSIYRSFTVSNHSTAAKACPQDARASTTTTTTVAEGASAGKKGQVNRCITIR